MRCSVRSKAELACECTAVCAVLTVCLLLSFFDSSCAAAPSVARPSRSSAETSGAQTNACAEARRSDESLTLTLCSLRMCSVLSFFSAVESSKAAAATLRLSLSLPSLFPALPFHALVCRCGDQQCTSPVLQLLLLVQRSHPNRSTVIRMLMDSTTCTLELDSHFAAAHFRASDARRITMLHSFDSVFGATIAANSLAARSSSALLLFAIASVSAAASAAAAAATVASRSSLLLVLALRS